MAVGTRIPLSVECQERTREAGHRHAQVQNGNIRQRLFLARSRGMQAVRPAKDQHRLLANQNSPQPRARPTEPRRTNASRLASNRPVAMQVNQTGIGNYHAASRCNPESQLIEDS